MTASGVPVPRPDQTATRHVNEWDRLEQMLRDDLAATRARIAEFEAERNQAAA